MVMDPLPTILVFTLALAYLVAAPDAEKVGCHEFSIGFYKKYIQMGVEKQIQKYHIITCIELNIYIYRSIVRYICILYYRHMINSFIYPIPCHVPITSASNCA